MQNGFVVSVRLSVVCLFIPVVHTSDRFLLNLLLGIGIESFQTRVTSVHFGRTKPGSTRCHTK